MNSPTAGFERLSLNPQMTDKESELVARKYQICDLISSFDQVRLPLEISPDVFESINVEQRDRDRAELTINSDLEGTIMSRAAHIPVLFDQIMQFQTPANLAIYFWQKLGRRFNQEIAHYDDPGEDAAPSVSRIANNLRQLEVGYQRDSELRTMEDIFRGEDVQAAFLRLHAMFVDIVQKVCERRGEMISPHRTRSSTRQAPNSLFRNLIGSPASSAQPFIIDTLDQISSDRPRVLVGLTPKLEAIQHTLEALEGSDGSPVARYISKLQVILSRSPMRTPLTPTAPAFAVTTPKPHERSDSDSPDPGPLAAQAGTKRPATQPSGRKRGRKTKK